LEAYDGLEASLGTIAVASGGGIYGAEGSLEFGLQELMVIDDDDDDDDYDDYDDDDGSRCRFRG